MNLSFKMLLNLRVEPYLLLIMLSYSVRSVTDNQIIQDKICKYEKYKPDEFCLRLSKISEDSGDSEDDIRTKSDILIEAAQFQIYNMALAFLPSVFVCLFLGSWCDNYIHGRKILLIYSSFGITLESLIRIYMSIRFSLDYKYYLLSSLPSALGAGLGTCFTAIFSYIPATTPHNIRPIRFMFVEVVTFLAQPLSGVLGGYLLNTVRYWKMEPIGKNGQLLNYPLVFIASLVFSVLSFFWAIFLVDETRDKQQLEKFDVKKAYEDMYVPKNGQPRPLPRTVIEKKPKKSPILMLFDCGNIKDIIKTCTKKRKNKARKQLWLLIFSLVFYLISHIGPLFVMYPFAEKVYLWNSSEFSYFNSGASLVNSIGTVLATIILKKLFKMSDIPLAIIGISAYFIGSILRGTILNLYGYYTAAAVGSIGAIANVGMRSHLSVIIDRDELGKVFSMIGSLDATTPLIANVIFTLIFTRTLDIYPGIVFEATAAMLFIPLFVLFWIDINCDNNPDNTDSERKNRTNSEPKQKVIVSSNNKATEPLTYRTTHGGSKTRMTTEL